MPRRSAASLSVIAPAPDAVVTLPRPSASASPEIVQLFGEIIGSVPREHFRQGDAHLLEQFTQSVLLARKAYTELSTHGPVVDGRRSPWLDVLATAHKSSAVLARG